MKVILLTGCEGFAGSHLLKTLQESRTYQVEPTCYPLSIPKEVRCSPMDILNSEMVHEVVKTAQPDIVFHLAAVSSVSKSFSATPLTYNTNLMGTVNLLEASKSLDKHVTFFYVSSCEIYGNGGNLSEDAPVVLKNPYAVSKYAAELACRNYNEQGLDCVILRPFTHTGPGQSRDFVLPTIAAQIAEIEKGKKPPLVELGNIDAKREFMNIQDVVNAYSLAIEKCSPGETYNIASGIGHTIKQALALISKTSRVEFEIRSAKSKVRKHDASELIGNGTKFSALAGWKPISTFKKTIEDLLNYWRAKI
jgi:GDP-4-dehydro-6-deoxy-D-mannose reductase